MAYTTPGGISVLNLATLEAKQLVAGPAKPIIVGHKTPNLYYTQATDDPFFSTLWGANLDTGEKRKLADLPRRASVVAINADETLGAGTFIEGDANAGGAYDGTAPLGRMTATNLGEPANKGEMMAARLAAKLPMTMFTIDLRTGKMNTLLEHSTDWLNHLQFSPDRPDASDLLPRGCLATGRPHLDHPHGRHAQSVDPPAHDGDGDRRPRMVGRRRQDGVLPAPFSPRRAGSRSSPATTSRPGSGSGCNTSADIRPSTTTRRPTASSSVGDGGTGTPWIFLFRPVFVRDQRTLGAHLIKGGYLESEKLVNMSKHNYRLEPNPSFTPDQKFIVFRSNMFGPDYAFAVEIAKAKPSP